MIFTREQLAAVFDEWARRYAERPDEFDAILDTEGRPVASYGARCTSYVERLAREIGINVSATIILSGPPGIGKTRHADELAALLGCSTVVDDWDGRRPLAAGALAITNAVFVKPAGAEVIEVADEAAIEALMQSHRLRSA